MNHLWEVKHPYYWNEGSFHERGMHVRHGSWSSFLEDMGGEDEDLNLVCRWDWEQEEADADEPPATPIPPGTGTLKVFYAAQRKGFTFSHEMPVTAADETSVRAWLGEKWKHMQRLWEPFEVSS